MILYRKCCCCCCSRMLQAKCCRCVIETEKRAAVIFLTFVNAMFNLQTTSTTMELLPLVCLYILAWSARTDQTDPPVTEIAVMEDDDVLLPCSFGAMDITNMAFDWKKENVTYNKREVFLYESGNIYGSPLTGQAEQFKGRVFHFPDQLTSGNASIQIKTTKVDDSGTYTCIKASTPPTTLSRVQLTVECVLKDRTKENVKGACPKPILESRKTDDGVLLQCDVLGASPQPEVEIQGSDGSRVDAKEHQNSNGDHHNIILIATVTMEGNYRCVVKQPEICHEISSNYIWVNPPDGDLKDRTGENTPGAAKKPYVTTLDETKDRALLECEVHGASPKPNVTWQDSAGNILPAEEPQITKRENRYDIILQTTVTKTDRYRCVATQEEIKHQTYSETHIQMDDPTGWIVGAFFCVLFVVAVVLLVLVCTGLIKPKCYKDSQSTTSLSCDLVRHPDPDPKEPLNAK
ncbi:CD276 antigen-like isoform X2 [Melanotaenia boesemani]|uniref:CD276 antigen-like isoform X2 n=1 Tax=Melanotaenia boesemani TaxID=1250792 RepID=UPI001C053E30|nr:CD276 antigen-like isoform X2 [Melanotaenia boesemani]